jgi:hypothetical protein
MKTEMTTKWNKQRIRQRVYENIKEIARMRATLFAESLYVGVRIYPDYLCNLFIGETNIVNGYEYGSNGNSFLLKFPMYEMINDFPYEIGDDGKPYDLETYEKITFKYAFDKVFDNIVLDTKKILNDELNYCQINNYF